MSLSIHKRIIPIQRIKPKIKKEPCKIAAPQNKAAGAQIVPILGDDEVDVGGGVQMGEGLDDALGDYGDAFQ